VLAGALWDRLPVKVQRALAFHFFLKRTGKSIHMVSSSSFQLKKERKEDSSERFPIRRSTFTKDKVNKDERGTARDKTPTDPNKGRGHKRVLVSV